ncbi:MULTISPECIES: phosphatidate cytidylyltransferase [unclassified Pseudoalteromonas]|uniref:phosphatidate cytidylyltransferase n=1 Tax=unclassified Pseudoalteromonas TaxID=194690 RepID=UPI000CF64129|nr:MULTISPECIES: phosphatidate cytidylyltransferase [unclassified Pseudoalteromonas]MBS3798658.1 phosphatidate cytidylyltransferase [Pseudoalteromonas sp. BDTF-M6]
MLKQRIITSLVLAPLALALVFLAPLDWFSYCAGGIVLLGAYEWSALMGICNRAKRLIYVALVAVLVALMQWHWPITALWQQGQMLPDINYVFTLALAWWIVATILVVRYPKFSDAWSQGYLMRGISGVLTLAPLWLALCVLRSANYDESSQFGSYLILAVLGIVWCADIGAYFSGKNFGKHKLMPKVSPNKTIEGFVGGLLSAAIFVLAFCYFKGVEPGMWAPYALMAVIVAAFSAVGDLLESMFKRQAGMKDSGKCLPGHGGILDRIDSLTAAAPIFVVFYAWTMTL